jgi:hypothetical protein
VLCISGILNDAQFSRGIHTPHEVTAAGNGVNPGQKFQGLRRRIPAFRPVAMVTQQR